MFTFIAKIFGYASRGELDRIKAELVVMRNDVIKLSNIAGHLAAKIDQLAIIANQQSATIDKVVRHQAEMTIELVAFMDNLQGLQTTSGRKNRQVALPSLIQGDDDDDLIN
jgi:hypothetical protein